MNVRFSFTGFHPKSRVLRVPWYLFDIPRQHAGHTRVAMVYQINTRAHEKFTKLKIAKMVRCVKKLDVVDESDEEIKRIFRY